MIDESELLGRLSILEGLVSEVKDPRLQAKMKAEIIILKQMLGG